MFHGEGRDPRKISGVIFKRRGFYCEKKGGGQNDGQEWKNSPGMKGSEGGFQITDGKQSTGYVVMYLSKRKLETKYK